MKNLDNLQLEIAKALEELGEKAPYKDLILIKKIRKNTGFEGKLKASLRYDDLEQAILYLSEEKDLHYTVKLDSVNNLLIKQTQTTVLLEGEDLRNRRKTEKALTLITGQDLVISGKNNDKGKGKKIKKINLINEDLDNW